MCGRFALNENPARMAEFFHLSGELEFSPGFNIAPSLDISSIVADENHDRHLRTMHWGLIPVWSKDKSIANKLINARCETVATKPSFRTAFKSRRCLIPASGFYEWQQMRGGKQPWFISLKTGNPLAIAGLWEVWHSNPDETIESCCIITTGANSLMEKIHDRMPVILSNEQWDTWLSPQEQDVDKLLPMMHACDSELLQAWPVTRDLNKVGVRDDAGLIEPVKT